MFSSGDRFFDELPREMEEKLNIVREEAAPPRRAARAERVEVMEEAVATLDDGLDGMERIGGKFKSIFKH